MGLRQSSRADKYRDPHSSWGSSIDNVFCAPGRACAEEWTPLPSRSNSVESRRLLQSQRSTRSRSAPYNEAEIYTLDHTLDDYYREEVITKQPMPVEPLDLSSPVNTRPRTPYPRKASKSSYIQSEYHPNYIDKPVKRKRKKRNMVKPVEPFVAHTGDLRLGRLSHLSRRTDETFAIAESSRRRRTIKKPRPSFVLTSVTSYMTPANTSRIDGSSALLGSRRVVPPRHKRAGEAPPHPFRIRGIPDDPYKRLKTANARINKL